MEWKVALMIMIAIIGFYGIFWTLNLSDMQIIINLNTDNNTLQMVNKTSEIIKQQNNDKLINEWAEWDNCRPIPNPCNGSICTLNYVVNCSIEKTK